MGFPSGPTNGQQVVVNNITYIYNSTKTAWYRLSTPGVPLSANSLVLTSPNISISTTSGALIVTGGAGIGGNLHADRYYTHNGLYWANNNESILGGLTYSNVEVAAYLTSQKITSANIGGSQIFANANAAAQQTQINSLITNANTNTAAYLSTYTGNVQVGNIVVTGNAYVTSNVFANIFYVSDSIRWAGNGAVFASGGGGSYANADVKIYLESLSNVNIGLSTGINQAAGAVAIGYEAGSNNQSLAAIGIGYGAGYNNQGVGAVAIGVYAGQSDQPSSAVAIGYGAGSNYQGSKSIAIGYNAGITYQGNGAIAIGSLAGASYQAGNSIIISANGQLDSTTTGFFVDPIRNIQGNLGILQYIGGTKEITFSNTVSVANVITGAVYTVGGVYWSNGAAYSTGGGGGGGGITFTAGNTTPASPSVGDQWYYVAGDILFEYINDGDTNQWVDIVSPVAPSSTVVSSLVLANVSISSVYNLNTTLTALGLGTAANLTIGNVITGIVSASGNINAANLTTSGNLVSGNINTGIITATGNVQAANLTTAGNVTASYVIATGNVQAAYLQGDGSKLTNLNAASTGKAIAMAIVFGG